MMRRDDFEETIKEAVLRRAELAIKKMPKDRPTQYNIGEAAKMAMRPF